MSSTCAHPTTAAACPSAAPGPSPKAPWPGRWASARCWPPSPGSAPAPRPGHPGREETTMATDQARAESRATFFFGLSALASVGLAVTYWQGGQPQVEGVLLAVITGGIGAAIVSWARHAM